MLSEAQQAQIRTIVLGLRRLHRPVMGIELYDSRGEVVYPVDELHQFGLLSDAGLHTSEEVAQYRQRLEGYPLSRAQLGHGASLRMGVVGMRNDYLLVAGFVHQLRHDEDSFVDYGRLEPDIARTAVALEDVLFGVKSAG